MTIERNTFLVLALACLVTLVTSCTLDDGEPWGFAHAQMSVPEPPVGDEFEVDSFTLELTTVRFIETTASAGGGEFDPQNPPPGCNLCHNGHCHCDGELIDYEVLRTRVAEGGTSRNVVANLDPAVELTSTARVDLGEASIGQRAAIDTVEVELAALRVDGTLTRDGEQIPTTISLPGIAGMAFPAPADLEFGPDAPEMQTVAIDFAWSGDWLDAVDIDQLELQDDGTLLIASTSNRDAAEAMAARVANSTITITE